MYDIDHGVHRRTSAISGTYLDNGNEGWRSQHPNTQSLQKDRPGQVDKEYQRRLLAAYNGQPILDIRNSTGKATLKIKEASVNRTILLVKNRGPTDNPHAFRTVQKQHFR